jgi:hypothetical protein
MDRRDKRDMVAPRAKRCLMLTRPGSHTPIANVQIAAIFRPCCVWSTPPDVDPQTRVGFSPPIRRNGTTTITTCSPTVFPLNGAFVLRFIRGRTSTLSNHAYGSAFDINADETPLGARPRLVGQRGATRELVPLANKWGFYWGGHFGSRPDGMHFEVAFLK